MTTGDPQSEVGGGERSRTSSVMKIKEEKISRSAECC